MCAQLRSACPQQAGVLAPKNSHLIAPTAVETTDTQNLPSSRVGSRREHRGGRSDVALKPSEVGCSNVTSPTDEPKRAILKQSNVLGCNWLSYVVAMFLLVYQFFSQNKTAIRFSCSNCYLCPAIFEHANRKKCFRQRKAFNSLEKHPN